VKIAALVFAVALAACGKKTDDKPGGTTGSATPVAASDAAVAAATPDAAEEAVDVPTEVDFEDTASSEITDKNLEAHLKAIESDLTE
jgi:hypothetical protein